MQPKYYNTNINIEKIKFPNLTLPVVAGLKIHVLATCFLNASGTRISGVDTFKMGPRFKGDLKIRAGAMGPHRVICLPNFFQTNVKLCSPIFSSSHFTNCT